MPYEKLMEIAKYLGRENDITILDSLDKLSNGGVFFITFIGQFSAGKSLLINNLLERNILPVKREETTSVLTYIKYGAEEEAKVFLDNGDFRVFSVHDIALIYEKSVECNVDPLQVEHIEISLCVPLLERGLVLIDTPGINTIIKRHIGLTAAALDRSCRVIYVLGGSRSKVDTDFIKKIVQCGLYLTFVRTKVDELNESEEHPQETLEEQKKDLADLLEVYHANIPMEYYAVSNNHESSYFNGVDNLRKFLLELSEHLDRELIRGCKSRAEVYYKTYREALSTRKAEFENSMDGQVSDGKKRLDELQEQINKLQDLLNKKDLEMQNTLKVSRQRAEQQMKEIEEEQVQKFDIESSNVKREDISRELETLYQNRIREALSRAQICISNCLDEMAEDGQDILAEVVYKMNLQCEGAPRYEQVEAASMAAIEEYKEKLLLARTTLLNLQNEKEKNSDIYKTFCEQNDEENLDQALLDLEKQISEIPKKICMRYADDQPLQPSAVMKRIGQAADIGLILLPAGTIAKGATMLIKAKPIAQMIHRANNLIKIVNPMNAVSVAKTSKKLTLFSQVSRALSKRAYSSASTEKNIQELVEKVGKNLEEEYSSRQNGNVLDMLSVEYWAEKAGSLFDSPPVVEVDQAVEREKTKLNQTLSQQKAELLDEKIRNRRERHRFNKVEEEISFRLEQQKKDEISIKQQLAREEQKVRECKINEYLVEYNQYFRHNIKEIFSRLIDSQYRAAEENFTVYAAKKNEQLIQKLLNRQREQKQQCEIINKGQSAIKKEIESCEAYLLELGE